MGCESCTRLLNSNQLSGQVPIEVYSSGVHGRFINLSSNAGLCGVPSMPSCPTSWKGDLLEGGKIGIVLVALVAAIVVVGVVYAFVKRRQSREDYNFNLPHQLAGKPQISTPKFMSMTSWRFFIFIFIIYNLNGICLYVGFNSAPKVPSWKNDAGPHKIMTG